MKKSLTVLSSSFSSCELYTLTSVRQPHSCICLKLGFQPFYNSKEVLGTVSVRILFNMLECLLSASLC